MNQPAVNFHDYLPDKNDFLADVLEGLAKETKMIPPKYFYDERGSELFDDICRQPEYYPTRTEIGILQNNAHDIASHIGTECMLIELGSGASEKVRLLFDALKPASYLGVDISKEFLIKATQQLALDYDWLEVHAVCADFSEQLELPGSCTNDPLVAFYPGSSIGNFEPREAIQLLRQIAETVGRDGKLIIGIDLKKDISALNAAYNDKAGVTADFNLNLLTRMRDELGAELDESAFEHQAFFNEGQNRIEMHLVSTSQQKIHIGDNSFSFHPGESIHTENSYKYDLESFSELAGSAGFGIDAVWRDAKSYFGVLLLSRE